VLMIRKATADKGIQTFDFVYQPLFHQKIQGAILKSEA